MCTFFVVNLTQGLFQNYKNILKNQLLKLKEQKAKYKRGYKNSLSNLKKKINNMNALQMDMVISKLQKSKKNSRNI